MLQMPSHAVVVVKGKPLKVAAASITNRSPGGDAVITISGKNTNGTVVGTGEEEAMDALLLSVSGDSRSTRTMRKVSSDFRSIPTVESQPSVRQLESQCSATSATPAKKVSGMKIIFVKAYLLSSQSIEWRAAWLRYRKRKAWPLPCLPLYRGPRD